MLNYGRHKTLLEITSPGLVISNFNTMTPAFFKMTCHKIKGHIQSVLTRCPFLNCSYGVVLLARKPWVLQMVHCKHITSNPEKLYPLTCYKCANLTLFSSNSSIIHHQELSFSSGFTDDSLFFLLTTLFFQELLPTILGKALNKRLCNGKPTPVSHMWRERWKLFWFFEGSNQCPDSHPFFKF